MTARDPDIVDVTTLPDLLLRAARRWPDHTALVFPDDRRTYAELWEGVERTARGLIALGVRPGEHVGVYMANCVDFVEVLFGAALAGAVVVPINARYRADELAYVIADADLAALVTSDLVAEHVDHVARVRDALRRGSAPLLRTLVALGRGPSEGFVSRDELTAAADTAPGAEVERRRAALSVRDVVLIMYTSGTTAHPKGCLISHEALVRNGIALGRQRFAIRDDDVFWDPLPMFHMSAVLPLVGVIDAGAAFASMVHFDAEAALDQMEREGATLAFPAFPTVTLALLNHPSFPRRDLRRLRMLNTTGPPETAYQVQRALPHVVQISPYGCTEAGGVVCFSEASDTPEQRATFSGRPFRGLEVRIVDPLGRPLPPGEPGEITVRGYALFDGYYKDPEKTAASVDADGFFHTGDLGVVDEDGRVQFRGRLKDMLKVGGENVAAAEIEALLCQHPAVAVCQVVGIPDPRLEEVPAAFVELVPGASASPEELIAFCRERVASFKVPRVVRQVSEWPMSATKILKRKLREQLLEELQASQAQG
ncbi:MAG TPA: class I adenylate-forming enzyme family protein, partial [Egibacteraceae bacterium]